MSVNIYYEISRLISYGLKKGLIRNDDVVYTQNRILEVLDLDEFQACSVEERQENPSDILNNILKWACENNRLIDPSNIEKELLDTKLIACLMPRPSEVIATFQEYYREDPQRATDYYYKLSQDSNYIRTDRIKKNQAWRTQTKYGELDITINLAKPEKDPKEIAAAREIKSSDYPKCLLCKENEGYRGRINHPPRQNHRIIPLELNNERWYLQYSPYIYYHEHCIVFKDQHEPMKISGETFDRLLEFTEKFPHYFIGSNSDLPIVGGSILSHDHFQGGHYEFAMARAPLKYKMQIKGYSDVLAGIIKWPMSTIRLRGADRFRLSHAAGHIFEGWKNYSDMELDILAHTKDLPHNTVTPIARRRGSLFELDLVLRNNRTNEVYPAGIFHPHQEVHHIKKENIGLIEVMGLAVLPPRLKDEIKALGKYLINTQLDISKDKAMEKHFDWYQELLKKHQNITEANVTEILKTEVGNKFALALEHAGVFKDNAEGDEGFFRFINSLNG